MTVKHIFVHSLLYFCYSLIFIYVCFITVMRLKFFHFPEKCPIHIKLNLFVKITLPTVTFDFWGEML